MSLGLNPVLPAILPLPSTPTGDTSDPAEEEAGTTDNTGGSSGAGGTTGTEQSSGSSSTGQTNETTPTQSIQPVSSDVAVAKGDRFDASRAEPSVEQEALAARKLAMKARSESIVAALIEAISQPIEAKELSALDEAEGPEAAAKTEAQTRADQFEEGLSAVRKDS